MNEEGIYQGGGDYEGAGMGSSAGMGGSMHEPTGLAPGR